jgi:hypothetical protein
VWTYVTWILALITLVWGAWAAFRPGGWLKPGKSDAGANRPHDVRVEEIATAEDESPPVRMTGLHPVDPSAGQAGPPGRTGTEAPVTGDRSRDAVPAVPNLGLWNDGYAQNVRDRWRDLQLRFIDDPHLVADEAERVVEETVAALTSYLNKFKEELGTWRSNPSDTEELRAAVYRYRDFLNRLVGS